MSLSSTIKKGASKAKAKLVSLISTYLCAERLTKPKQHYMIRNELLLPALGHGH
jgi:hypothetical protein